MLPNLQSILFLFWSLSLIYSIWICYYCFLIFLHLYKHKLCMSRLNSVSWVVSRVPWHFSAFFPWGRNHMLRVTSERDFFLQNFSKYAMLMVTYLMTQLRVPLSRRGRAKRNSCQVRRPIETCKLQPQLQTQLVALHPAASGRAFFFFSFFYVVMCRKCEDLCKCIPLTGLGHRVQV